MIVAGSNRKCVRRSHVSVNTKWCDVVRVSSFGFKEMIIVWIFNLFPCLKICQKFNFHVFNYFKCNFSSGSRCCKTLLYCFTLLWFTVAADKSHYIFIPFHREEGSRIKSMTEVIKMTAGTGRQKKKNKVMTQWKETMRREMKEKKIWGSMKVLSAEKVPMNKKQAFPLRSTGSIKREK